MVTRRRTDADNNPGELIRDLVASQDISPNPLQWIDHVGDGGTKYWLKP